MDDTTGRRRYSAFVSYSHHDLHHARWLQRRIEWYRVPRALRDSVAVQPNGRLLPVFRDIDELTAAADLTEAVRDGLAASHHLIVVCTPAGAASHWVAREIELFRSLHPSASVLAALFEGSSATAFPPPLMVGAAGAELHPLAADFRPGGARGSRRLALLKLIAVVAGVGLDDLVRRDAQRRWRQIMLAAAAAALVVLAIGVTLAVAMQARAQARAEQQRGIATVERLVRQRDQVAKAGNLDLLKTYDRSALDFFRDQNIAALPPAAQLLSAKLLQGVCEDDETGGDFAGMREAAATAWYITDRLLAAAPRDPERLLAHGASEFWRGNAAWRLGDMRETERRFIAYAAVADRLLAFGPTNPAWLVEAGDADSNLATYLLRARADVPRAGRFYRRAQDRFEAAAKGPWDHDVQAELADGYGWLAEIERLRGAPAAALGYRDRERVTIEAMGRRDPTDAGIEPKLIKSRLGTARVLAEQRQWPAAIAAFDGGRAQAAERLRRDPTNRDMARLVRAYDLFEVRTWLDMPKAERPPAARIAAALGDCAAERAKPHNDEVAGFCDALAARSRRDGDGVAATPVVATRPSALTQRWSLDLAAEAARF